RLVAVRMPAGDVDRDGIVVADVLRERLPGLAVEHHDPDHPLEAHEEIVLPTLVVVQRTNHAASRPREVQLADRLRELRRTRELAEPPALVLVSLQLEPGDDHLLAPVSSIRRPTWARSPQCLPPSCHHPSTRRTSSSPRCA